MKLKIVSYNILNGFCTDKLPYEFEKNRIPLASKLIEKENPDILILCEAWMGGFVKKHSMKNLGKFFDRIYNLPIPPVDSFRYSPVILSKYPIEKGEGISEHFKNGVRGIVKLKDRILTIDAVHPAPKLTEAERADWFSKLTALKKSIYIIAGDFNALSSKDGYDKDKMIADFAIAHKEKSKEIVEKMLQPDAIDVLIKNNLVDSYNEMNRPWDYSYPTKYRKDGKDFVRIDYIFCSKDFRVLDAGIIKNKLAEIASDHYPVFAVVEI